MDLEKNKNVYLCGLLLSAILGFVLVPILVAIDFFRTFYGSTPSIGTALRGSRRSLVIPQTVGQLLREELEKLSNPSNRGRLALRGTREAQ